ncbi:hypothetical protein RJT34_18639 [Clitoria ternatea]|uniref:Uncharacterized protein n=1 Tax=Clitoria ternatea TaxID=43366 RepID=A0AAN9PG22_CLITE
MDNRRQLSQQGRRSIRHASTGLEAAHKSPAPYDAYNSAGLEGAHNSAAPHDAHSSPALEAAHNSAGRHDTIRDHQQYALEGRRSVSSLMEFYQKPHMGKVETLNKLEISAFHKIMLWLEPFRNKFCAISSCFSMISASYRLTFLRTTFGIDCDRGDDDDCDCGSSEFSVITLRFSTGSA